MAFGLSLEYYHGFFDFVLAVGRQEFFRDSAVNYAFAAALARLSPIFAADLLRVLALLALLITGLFFVQRAGRATTFRTERIYAVLICLMTILSPVFWYHHLAWILAPLAVLGMIRLDNREAQVKFRAAGVALFLLLSQTYLIQRLAAGTGLSYLQPLMALMPTALLVFLMWQLTVQVETT